METTPPPTPQKPSLFKPFITTLSLLFFINLCIINYLLFKQVNTPQQPSTQTPSPTPIQSPHPTTTLIPCDESCVKNIVKEATAAITLTPLKTPPPQKQIPTRTVQITTPPQPREIYISLGSGQNAAGDWSDIPNTEKTISPSQYGNIKSIVFEATLSVPKSQGIAYVRLYNATDSQPISGSDLTATTATPTLLTSQHLTLEGTKLYKVQLKQSLQNDAVLTQSRIKITLN
jgi:hypothetical protein